MSMLINPWLNYADRNREESEKYFKKGMWLNLKIKLG